MFDSLQTKFFEGENPELKGAVVAIDTTDDPVKDALKFKEALSKKLTLKKNTVGIIVIGESFLKDDFIFKVMSEFDFPIAGVTSSIQGVGGKSSIFSYSLSIITSDVVEFSVGCFSKDRESEFTDVESIQSSVEKSFSCEWEKTLSELKSEPRFLLVFTPFFLNFPTDVYINALTKVTKNTPAFGTAAASDYAEGVAKIQTVQNFNKDVRDGLIYIAFSGIVNMPEFFVSEPVGIHSFNKSGIITKTRKNDITVIEEIDNKPAIEYLQEIGIIDEDFYGSLKNGDYDTQDGSFEFLHTFPFMIKNPLVNSSVRRMRGIFRIDKEGSLYMTSAIEEGSVILGCFYDGEGVEKSTKALIEKIKAKKDGKFALIFSCMARRFLLTEDPLIEAVICSELVDEGYEYLFTYSGGEFVPYITYGDLNKKTAQNVVQNYSCIACVF